MSFLLRLKITKAIFKKILAQDNVRNYSSVLKMNQNYNIKSIMHIHQFLQAHKD